ncbi:putative phage abortive infection protein [Rhizobium giardinii]|uniref:putative phage abortive infection protein n=1 Tax=Rhizobium giardinii TaxID=56731 RepID=UPI003D6FF26F
MKNEEEIPPAPSIGYLFIAVALVAAFWLANLWYGSGLDHDSRGLFGDMFGAVNALFSGLAFAGVAYAIVMQRYEVALARQENSDTKKLLTAQEQQIKRQNEATEKQVFEATFFQLVRLLNDITNNMVVVLPQKGSGYTGRDALAALAEELRTDVYEQVTFDKRFETFYGQNSSKLGHYLRMLYNIIKFIDKSPFRDEGLYSNIVRAQLSDGEVELLFYNGLGPYGRLKFKPLIERYALLKNFSPKNAPPAHMMSEYDPVAYGDWPDGSRLGLEAAGIVSSRFDPVVDRQKEQLREPPQLGRCLKK